MRIRIGYAHVDRLLRYPDVRYLSGCSLPIRMRSAWRWSACAASFARRVDSFSGQALQASRRPPGGVWSAGPCDLRRSSFARNSPEDVSGFEIRSLIFRGFCAVDEWGPGGITCDFGEGVMCIRGAQLQERE